MGRICRHRVHLRRRRRRGAERNRSFERVGWTDAFSRGPEGDQFKLDETMGSDALLLGRVTYDGFAPVWPRYDGEFADKFNTMPKYVVSSDLDEPRMEQHHRAPRRRCRRGDALKEQYEGDIAVHGSPQLAQTLIEHDLVDELHLQVYPVIVGAGKRLFGETSATKRLRLAEAKTVGDGIHILIYERAD